MLLLLESMKPNLHILNTFQFFPCSYLTVFNSFLLSHILLLECSGTQKHNFTELPIERITFSMSLGAFLFRVKQNMCMYIP